MKHTMFTAKDAVIIPTGLSAPVWVSEATDWLGFFIGVLTIIYFIFKNIDTYYHWRHNRWKQRKEEKKRINNKER